MTLQAQIPCVLCGKSFNAAWQDDTPETVTTPPQADVRCPHCGGKFSATYPGWSPVTGAL